jgi:Uma2 family endonuclease
MGAVLDERPRMLAEVAEHLEVPHGYRVEVVAGVIVVTPPADVRHAKVAMVLRDVLKSLLPTGFVVVENVAIGISKSEPWWIPDLLVMSDVVFDGKGWDGPGWMRPTTDITLAVEITSPGNLKSDRVNKPREYAQTNVPLYLLVDTSAQTVTLYSEPDGDSYQSQLTVRLGAQLALPEPFEGELDTAAFP